MDEITRNDLSHAPVSEPIYVNTEVCKECGGVCCKNQPGAAFPEDFGAPDKDAMLKRIVEALKTGNWSIDWWEGDPREPDMPMTDVDDHSEWFVKVDKMRDEGKLLYSVNFLRPRTKKIEPSLTYFRDATWGGECNFLTPAGCTLPYEKRPRGCRLLEPRQTEDGKCVDHSGGKERACLDWIPYQDTIKKAEVMAGG